MSKFFGPLPLNKIFLSIWYIFFPSSKILHRFISFEKKSLDFEDCLATVSNNPEFSYWLCPENVFTNVGIFSKCQSSRLARKTERGASYRVAVAAHILTRHFRQPCCTISLYNTTQHTQTQTQTIWRQRCSTMDLWDRAFTVFWFAAIVLSTTCVHRWRQLHPPTHTVSFPVPIQGLHDPQKSNSNDCLAKMNI